MFNQQKIIRSGNSLALTIPAKLVKNLGLKAGDAVKVTVPLDQSQINYFFESPRQLTLSSQAPLSSRARSSDPTKL